MKLLFYMQDLPQGGSVCKCTHESYANNDVFYFAIYWTQTLHFTTSTASVQVISKYKAI